MHPEANQRLTDVRTKTLLSKSNTMDAAPPTTVSSSSLEWKDLLEDLLPPQGEWSEEEYLVLTDHRNRLVEFTDGFLEVLPTPTTKHQILLKFLFLAFFNFFDQRGSLVLLRRCGCESGHANSASPISCSYFRRLDRAARTVSGKARTWPWRSSVKTNRSAVPG